MSEADAAKEWGVVHFLFLVNDHLPHSDIWRKYFSEKYATPGTWKAWVHCQDQEACEYSGLLDMPNFEMVETTPTWYCHDLVTAMARLLSSALEHRPSGQKVAEKFVFISDSTLPIKPYSELHWHLMEDDDSDFCLFPKDQWGRGEIDGHDVLLAKHHQWLVLNRPHAELFVREWVPVTEAGQWRVWLKGGSWAGEERFVSPQHFYHPPSTNWCTDEWAFFATIFGAVEPRGKAVVQQPGFGGGSFHVSGPTAFTTQGRCRTFTFWTHEDGPAFADLAGAINRDWDSQISCYPICHRRPATIEKLSDRSLQAARHSPFLFMRKMSEWIELPGYEKIVMR